ncbi:MAG: thioredoxin domain-containing protein [Candidatus Scalindua sp.]
MKAKVLLTITIVAGVIAALFIFNRYRPETKIASQAVAEMEARKNSNTAQASTKYPDINLLGKEKSPYLLQHADNPVHWYPWGDEAFAKAKAEDKPIFLSIGYSTCHWCHVMEHESFEKQEIADVMNKYFVSIKVDREERPDIDNIYMKAVQTMTGSGGWPLSIFLTHDRKPFYGGTYFPPESQWGRPGFKELLLSINDGWQNKRSEFIRTSNSITNKLQSKPFWQNIGGNSVPGKGALDQAYLGYSRRFDSRYGGFGGAPKFPTSHNLSYILRYWNRTKDTKALQMVEKTLTEMAKGGMYDQIGGGFHRYSTDQRWHIPHFEKMLYDQAILSKTYLEAYQITKNKKYEQIAREIFKYVLRDMTDPQGGFYSAEDADSFPPEEFMNMSPDPSQSDKKKEGAFYLWRQKEIEKHLGKNNASVFNFYYGVQSRGNARSDPHGEFRGKNILYVANSLEETAQRFKKPVQEIERIIREAREKLFKVRDLRIRSHLDDKVLVDWNGLMISSLAFGSRVLNDPKYMEAAEKSAQFILNTLVRKEDGRLLHRYRDGEASILGTIEDYAFFIHGLIDLYEATFKEEYLKEAKRLTSDMVKLFWDKKDGGFFFTASDAEKLLYREKEIYDGAIPSGNSFAALDLLRMGRLTFNRDWENKAEQLFKTFGRSLSAQSLIALDFALGPSKEIVISGDKENELTKKMVTSLYDRFIPNKVVILRPLSDKKAKNIISLIPFVEKQKALGGKTTAYVCENYNCKFPTTNLKKFEELLDHKEVQLK